VPSTGSVPLWLWRVSQSVSQSHRVVVAFQSGCLLVNCTVSFQTGCVCQSIVLCRHCVLVGPSVSRTSNVSGRPSVCLSVSLPMVRHAVDSRCFRCRKETWRWISWRSSSRSSTWAGRINGTSRRCWREPAPICRRRSTFSTQDSRFLFPRENALDIQQSPPILDFKEQRLLFGNRKEQPVGK